MDRRHWQDLGLASLTALLVGLSPLSSHNLIGSVAVGLLCGAGIYLWRRRSADPSAGPAPAEPAGRALPVSHNPLVWLTLVLVVVALGPTLRWMYLQWTSSIWTNSHGILVPVAMIYLGYHALKYDDSDAPESSAWGFAFLVPGLLLLALDAAPRTRFLSSIGLVACLPGFSLLLLGARRTRLLTVPLLTGIFMIPVPDTPAVHLTLRSATAIGVEPMLAVLGFEPLRDGTAIQIGAGQFIVANACSGFATLYAAVAMAIILACYTRDPRRRILVLLCAIPLAYFANVLRVGGLILLVHFAGPWLLDTPLHELTGVLTFWIVLFLLWQMSDAGRAREPQPA